MWRHCMQLCTSALWCAQAGQDLTAVAFEECGLQCAVGTSQGLVAVFDLRAAKPLAVKDHMYSDAIRSIQYHQLPSDSGELLVLIAQAGAAQVDCGQAGPCAQHSSASACTCHIMHNIVACTQYAMFARMSLLVLIPRG